MEEKYPVADYTSMYLTGTTRGQVEREQGSPVSVSFNDSAEDNYKAVMEQGLIPKEMGLEEFRSKVHQPAKERYSKERQWEAEEAAYQFGRRPIMNYLPQPNAKLRQVDAYSSPADPRFTQDLRGRKTRVRTDEEVFEEYGTYKAKDGSYQPLDRYQQRNKFGSPTRVGKDGEEYVLQQEWNPDLGRNEWVERTAGENLKQSQLRSMHGPKPMRRGWVDAFMEQFTNAWVDLGDTTVGSMAELAGYAANKVNSEWGNGLMARGRQAQNLAGIRKSKMSEAYENATLFGPGKSAEKWLGELGNLTGQISSVVAMGYLSGGLASYARGAGITSNLLLKAIQRVPTLGYMGIYAGAMADQEAKELGMTMDDRMYLYPKMVAMNVLTEAYLGKLMGGRNWLEGGLGYFEQQAVNKSVRKGLRDAIASNMDNILARNLDDAAAAEIATSTFAKVGTKLKDFQRSAGRWMEQSRMGRAITGGFEEGFEEGGQNIAEQGIKMWTDYANYGTLDAEGKERKPGQGSYGLYGEGGAHFSELFDGLKENIVLGFIGGHIPGYFTAKPRETEDLLTNFTVAKHAVEMAYEGLGVADAEKFVDKVMEEDYDYFNYQQHDGTLASIGQEGDVTKRTDYIREHLKNQYRLAFATMDNKVASGDDLQRKMGGDKDLLAEGIAMQLNAEMAGKEVEKMQSEGVAADSPELLRAMERRDKALDYSNKVFNGDVYGHYLAVEQLNRIRKDKQLSSADSNADFDRYMSSPSTQEANGTVLGDVRSISQESVSAQQNEAMFRETHMGQKDKLQAELDTFRRFAPADSIIGDITDNDEARGLMEKVSAIKDNGFELTQGSLDELGEALETAKYRTMGKLFSALGKDEQDAARKDPFKYFLESDATSNDEKKLLEFDAEKEFKPADDAPDQLYEYQNTLKKAKQRKAQEPGLPMSELLQEPPTLSDEDVDRSVETEIAQYPARNSKLLADKLRSNNFRDHYYGSYASSLLQQLESDDPVLPADAMQTVQALIGELDRKEAATLVLAALKDRALSDRLTEGEKGAMYRSLGVPDGEGGHEMAVESALSNLNIIKLQRQQLQWLLPGIAALEGQRGQEMEQFARGLYDVRKFVVEQMAGDYGLSFPNIRDEAGLTDAEEALSQAMRANPMASWKEGSAFRKLLNGQGNYPLANGGTDVWERRVNGKQSLFTQHLKDFTLERFHNPLVSPLESEWETPSFRKHFVINHAMSLMGSPTRAFAERMDDIAQAGGITGGISHEQMMVLQHLDAWSSMMSNGTERKLLAPFENFYRLNAYLYDYIDDGSWKQEEPSLRLMAFLPFLTPVQRAGLDQLDDMQDRIAYMETEVSKIPEAQFAAQGTTRAKVEEEISAFWRMGLDPQADENWRNSHDEHAHIPGSMMVQGNQGSGKTTRLLSVLMQLMEMKRQAGAPSAYDSSRPLVVVHSTALAATYTATMDELNARLQAMGLQPVRMEVKLKNDFFNELRNRPTAFDGRMVVFDEATLMTKPHRRQLRDVQQSNAQNPSMMLLLLGDRYQTADGAIRDTRNIEYLKTIEDSTMGTHNLTAIYRSGQVQVAAQIAANMHSLRFNYTAARPMSIAGGRYWMSQDGTKRRGMNTFLQYDGTDPATSIVAHVKQRIAQGDIENMAIVVSSVKEAREALTKLTGDTSGDFDNGVGARIFTFDEEDAGARGNLNIQGLGVEQVYFMPNPANIGREGYTASMDAFNRMLNTSIGRMRDDGTPTDTASRMGYWAGIAIERSGVNSSVENAWNITSNSMEPSAVASAENAWKQRISSMLGRQAQAQAPTTAPAAQTAAPAQAAAPVPATAAPAPPAAPAPAPPASAPAPQSTVAATTTIPVNAAIQQAEEAAEEATDEAAGTIADELQDNEAPAQEEEPSLPPPASQAAVVTAVTNDEKLEALVEQKLEAPPANTIGARRVFAYPVNVGGKSYTFVKGDTVVTENGHKRTVDAFNLLTDGSVTVETLDTDRENPAEYRLEQLSWDSEQPKGRQVSAPKNDTELLVHHGMSSLRMDVVPEAYGTVKMDMHITPEDSAYLRSIKFQMFMSLNKKGGYASGLALTGTYVNDRFEGPVIRFMATPANEADEKHYASMVEKAIALSDQRLKGINHEFLENYFRHFGTMPIKQDPELVRGDGSVGDWQAMNNLRLAIASKLSEGDTVNASFQFGRNSVVVGSRRNKKAGPKRLLTGFLQDMGKIYDIDFDPAVRAPRNNFAVLQDPDVRAGSDTGTYIYYDVMGERGEVRRFVKNPRVGRIELLSLPLQQEAELMDETERNFQQMVVSDYLLKMEKAFELAETSNTSDRHNEWRSIVSDFIRYNRKAITAQLLGGGKRPAMDKLRKMGLAMVPDTNGEALSDRHYSILAEGMGVRPEKTGTDRYYYSNTNLAAAKKLHAFLKSAVADNSLNDQMGNVRLPTSFHSGVQVKALATDNPWQAYSHLMINSDYSPTLPMPVVSTNLLDLLSGNEVASAVRQQQRAEANVQLPQAQATPPVEVPLPDGRTLAVHPDGTYELGGERLSEKDFVAKYRQRYNQETGSLEDAAPAGRSRRNGRGGSNFIANLKPPFPSFESYTMYASEARQMVERMLGPVFAANKLEMREGLQLDGVELYGALYRAGIFLDTANSPKGPVVERSTPAEEAWHKLFEEVVDDDTYKAVNQYFSVKNDMYYDGGVANEELRESIAKEFSKYAMDRTYRADGKARTNIAKFVRDLFDAVLQAIRRAFNLDPVSQAFYDAYHGRYADQVSAQVRFELETGQLPNNRTFDGLGQEVLANSKGRANTRLAMNAFDGDVDVVYSAQHYVGRLLYSRGFFNPAMDPYDTQLGLRDTLLALRDDIPYFAARLLERYGLATSGQLEDGESFRFTHGGIDYELEPHELPHHRQKLADLLGGIGLEGSFNVNEEYQRFTHVRSLRAQDLKAVSEREAEGKTAYFLHKLLSNEGLLESLLQREMDRMPINAVMNGDMPEQEAISLGGFIQDSIDSRGSDSIEMSTRMSDVLRNTIRHTPLLRRAENGGIEPSNGYFDYEVGLKVLEDIYTEASLPDTVDEPNLFDVPTRTTRWERVRGAMERQLQSYAAEGMAGQQMPRYAQHLLSLYERFFNPGTLSFSAYSDIGGFDEWRARLDNMYDAGHDVGEHDSTDFEDFDASLAHMKRFASAVAQGLDSMFGDIRKARMSKTYAYKAYSKILDADGKWTFPENPVLNTRTVQLRSDSEGDVRHSLDHQVLAFAFDDPSSMLLSDRFIDVWSANNSPNKWREGNPVHIVNTGANAGIYYVPNGMSKWDAVNDTNRLASFRLDENGLVSSIENNRRFVGDRQKVVGEVMEAFGIKDLYRAKRVLSQNVGDITFNDFIDIAVRFSLASKQLVNAAAPDGPREGYSWWMDALDKSVGSTGYGRGPVEMISGIVLSAEDELVENDNAGTGPSGNTTFFTFFFHEMNTIATANATGNGVLGSSYVLGVNGNRHQLRLRPTAYTRGIDESGSRRWAARAAIAIREATVDGKVVPERLDSSFRHLVTPDGRMLHPLLDTSSGMSLKPTKYMSGFRTGISGKEVSDMNMVDLTDFFIGNFLEYNKDQSHSGQRKGWVEVTISPDADRTQRLGLEMDIRTPWSQSSASDWVGHGTYDVRRETDKDGNSHMNYRLAHRDILYHLNREAQLRRNYQQQSADRLVNALLQAVERGEVTDAKAKETIAKAAAMPNGKEAEFVLREMFKENPKAILPQHLRFSGAYEGRDYIVSGGYVTDTGNEAQMRDPSGQEPVMHSSNIRAIERLVKALGGFDGNKWPSEVEYRKPGESKPSMHNPQQLVEDMVEQFFGNVFWDFSNMLNSTSHKPLQSWNLPDSATRFNPKSLPVAYKALAVTHYVSNTYLNSYVGGTPYRFKSAQQFNKRNRSATSDYNLPGDVDPALTRAVSLMRRVVVEDPDMVHVLGNFYDAPGESAHVADLKQTDGLSEDNPIARYLWHTAFGSELGTYPLKGHAKTIEFAPDHLTKHSKGTITADSVKFSRSHQRMLARMLDPMGRRFLPQSHPNRQNLYEHFMREMLPQGVPVSPDPVQNTLMADLSNWDAAVRSTAELYMSAPERYPIIGEVNRRSTQKDDAPRKVVQHGEFLDGGMLEGGALLPNSTEEAMALAASGRNIDHWTEAVDYDKGGVSNTIASSVDEGFENFSAQLFPILLAAHADQKAAQEMKDTVERISLRGMDNYLKKLGSSIQEFRNELYSGQPPRFKRAYAKRIMTEASRQGLDKTGDRGHLQALMFLQNIGMEVKAKGVKTDQLFQSAVRSAGIKFSVAGQRSVDNVVYDSDFVEHEGLMWTRKDLMQHLTAVDPASLASVATAQPVPLKPMRAAYAQERVASHIAGLREARVEDFQAYSSLTQNVPWNEQSRMWVGAGTKPLVLVDGERTGVLLPMPSGGTTILWSDEQPVLELEPQRAQAMREVDENYRLARRDDAELGTVESRKAVEAAAMLLPNGMKFFREAEQVKNAYAQRNGLVEVLPGDIIAPSSYAKLVQAENIPLNMLFGRYDEVETPGVANLRTEMARLRSEYQEANAAYAEALQNGNALAEDEALQEIERIEQTVAMLYTEAQRQRAEGPPLHTYKGLRNLGHKELAAELRQGLEKVAYLNHDGELVLNEASPNRYLLRRARTLSGEFKSASLNKPTMLGDEMNRSGYNKMAPTEQPKVIGGIQDRAYNRWLDMVADTVAHDLHKLEGELDAVMVRTPSTGAHSGGHYRVVEFSHGEDNTVRQSAMNFTASGKDLDGDAVTIYHRPYLHPGLDREGDTESYEMMTRYMDFMAGFYDDPRHAPTVFDPINTKYPTVMADNMKENQRQWRTSVGTDVQTVYQSYSGKHTVGNSALRLKQMSYFMSALRHASGNIYWYNRNIEGVQLQEMDISKPYSVFRQMNGISTVTNLGADNSKDQTLGTLGITRDNVDTLMQLMSSPEKVIGWVTTLQQKNGDPVIPLTKPVAEQLWDAIFYLFGNEVVKRWVGNQQFFGSIRMIPSNNSSYMGLTATLKALPNEKDNIEATVAEMEQEIKLSSNRMAALQQNNRAPKRGTEEYKEWKAEKNKLQGIKRRKAQLENLMSPEVSALLFNMAKAAVQADQMTNFGMIANLNQGLPSSPQEVYNMGRTIETVTGLPLRTVYSLLDKVESGTKLRNVKLNPNNLALATRDGVPLYSEQGFELRKNYGFGENGPNRWMLKGSTNQYLSQTVNNGLEGAEYEEMSYTGAYYLIDFLPAIMENPEIRGYLHLLRDKMTLLDNDRLQTLPAVRQWQQRLLDRVGRDSASKSLAKWLENRTEEFFVGQFVSQLVKTDRDLQGAFNLGLQIPVDRKENGKVSRDMYEMEADLSTAFGTDAWMHHFPQWFETRKQELIASDPQRYGENTFLANLSVTGNANINYLTSSRAEKGQENQRRADFKALPVRERKMLSVYAMLKDGLNYRSGSLIEQLDEWMYTEFSNWAKDRIYDVWGETNTEAEGRRLTAALDEYGEFLLSSANKYFLKRDKTNGSTDKLDDLVLGRNEDGRPQWNMRVPAHLKEGKLYRSAFTELFNAFRQGNANIVELKSSVDSKEEGAVSHQVHFSLPLSNRTEHLKQIAAALRGGGSATFRENFGELVLKLPNADMAKRYRNGDLLYFPDGTIGTVTDKTEVDGYPAKKYRLLIPQSMERMRTGTLHGPLSIAPVADVRRAVMSFGESVDRSEAIRQSKSLTSAIRRAFPRIEVREIRQADADRMGRRQSEGLSFIQDGVAYLNLDKVKPSTVVHELVGHMASAAMYLYNPDAWQAMATGLKGSSIEELVKLHEPHLTGDGLSDEVIATFIEMVGGNRVDPLSLDRNLWQIATDWLGRMWNKIKSVFLKDPTWLKGEWFAGMTLEDMASKLIEETVKGNLTAPFTSQEYAAMWGGLRRKADGTKLALKERMGFEDMVQLLENNPFGTNTERRTINRQASYIFEHVQRQGPKNGVKSYFSALLNESVEFTESEYNSPEALKEAVQRVAAQEQQQRQRMGENMLGFLERISYGTREDVLTASKQTIRKHYSEKNADDFLLDEVRTMQNLMGFDGNDDLAMGHADGRLANYGLNLKSAWLPSGTIVVVHNARQVDTAVDENERLRALDDVSFSLFNVMDTGIKSIHSREDHFVLGQSDLFENDGKGASVRLTNGMTDMLKLRQVMALAASDMSANEFHRPKVRRLGVISLYADSNAVDEKHGFDYSLSDVDTLMPQAQALLKDSKIRNHLDDEMSALADSGHRWKADRYRQPLLDQLRIMAQSKKALNGGNLRDKLWEDVYTITLDHLDPAKSSQSMRLGRAARMLMRDMERKDFKGNPKRMLVHPSYKLLAQAAEQAKAVNSLGRLSFKPRNWFMLNFDTANNFSDPILEHWFDQMQKALWQSNQELQGVVNATNSAVEKRAKEMNIGKGETLLKENSRKLFGRLYRHETYEDATETGRKVDINTYELHWNENDPKTIEALAAGRLERDDLVLANAMLDQLEKYLVGAIINENMLDGRRRTEEEARNHLFNTMNYRRGMLPVLSKSFGETLARSVGRNKSETDAAISVADAMLHSNMTEYGLFETTDKGEDILDRHLGHVMLMQIRQPELRDFRLGLRKVEMPDGSIKTLLDGKKGLKRNASLTENLQSIVNYTAALTTRVEAFQTHFIDTHRNVVQLVAGWGMLEQKAKDSQDIRNMLDTIYQRVVLGRTQELKPIGFNLPGGKRVEVSMEATINLLGKLFSHAVLGLRPQQFLKELMVLSEESYAFGYANELADNEMYGRKELNEAIRLFIKDPAFVHKLNEAYLVANKTERDLIGGRWNVATLKHILESDTMHIATSFTNYQARMVLMAAQMIKDGSLKAHSVVDGKLRYDPKLDDRFAENGQLTDNGRKILDEIRQNNRDTKTKLEGVDQRDTDDFLLGYDSRNKKRLNAIADMYVTGGVSPDILSAGMSNAFFRAFMLFRSFSTPKLQRWLSGGAKGSVGQYAIDEEGNVIHSAPEFKSIVGSLANMMHQLREHKFKPKAAWAEMSEEDKYNVRLSMIDSLFVLASLGGVVLSTYVVAYLFGLVGLADPDEEDPDKALEIADGDTPLQVLLKGSATFILDTSRRGIKEVMSDVDPTNIPRQMMQNPFPAFGYVENALDAIQTALRFTDKDYAQKVADKFSYQVPGLGLIRDTDFFWIAAKRAMLGVDEGQ